MEDDQSFFLKHSAGIAELFSNIFRRSLPGAVRPVGQVAQNFQVAGNGSMAGHFSISVHAIMGATYKPLGLF